MQVSATLIAAQQAAREAQVKFHANNVAAAPQPGFAAALEKTAATGNENFSPLPLRQTVSAPQPAPTPANPAARLGTMVDIKI